MNVRSSARTSNGPSGPDDPVVGTRTPATGEHSQHPTPGAARPVLRRHPLVVALLSAMVASALTLAGGQLMGAAGATEPSTTDGHGTVGPPQETGTSLSPVELAEAVAPAVADVTVTGPGRSAGPRETATGSAVVFRADGYLLTNAHVVADADTVAVQLADGSSHDAEVVGTDAASDLAVLRIDADDLPTPEFADSPPEVGAATLAIGSPFGLEGTVTSGIVSALDRTLAGPSSTLTGLVQTDAAINPGNSGGALVDEQGQVIGINTAIYSRSGANDGVGFAVPSPTARDVAQQLIETGEVTWASLGVVGGDVDATVADAYDLPVDRGALLVEVAGGSAADVAGLQPGDIVVAAGGAATDSMADLATAIRAREPGDELRLELLRDGDRREVTAELDAD